MVRHVDPLPGIFISVLALRDGPQCLAGTDPYNLTPEGPGVRLLPSTKPFQNTHGVLLQENVLPLPNAVDRRATVPRLYGAFGDW